MDSCDVLIIGGGPAGSTCAGRLRVRGLDVVVADKAGFPRDKVCAGWITTGVARELGLDPDSYGNGRVLQPITGFRTAIGAGPDLHTDYGRVVSYGIRRCEFDQFLLERSGARLRLEEPVKTLRREGAWWVMNDAVRAPMLVGAGGHFCPVARHLGARVGRGEPVVAAKEVEFPMTAAQQAACRVDGEVPELVFCDDLSGYGWCFRKGAYLNIGLGREDNHRLSEQLAEFCDLLKARGRIPADIPSRFHGHAYLLYGHGPRQLLDDGVLLIGDAAGLAYPQSGEGIRPAVESGLMAAEVIAAARGQYSAAFLAPYEQRLRARFGDGRGGITDRIPARLKTFLASRLLTSPWFTRHVVLDRWFLHAGQAPLEGVPG
ncbi:MAG TPA: NAD(P)/FAD-dependent oxidoreductase [Gammaproteobacteria bacterium]|nr:NAD(P)/FAD-dependent oxidoreductase [Gammaproteobacteria bacterium]